MKLPKTFEEITPLSARDCFVVMERTKKSFTFPLHVHPECELNLIERAQGALRIVGDSEELIDDEDLVFITNPHLEHAWVNRYNNPEQEIHEVTIQLNPEFLVDQILIKEQFANLRTLFQMAKNGVAFDHETIARVRPMIQEFIDEKNGLFAVTKLLHILYELSISTGIRQLASSSFTHNHVSEFDIRLDKVIAYIRKNYQRPIYMPDAAAIVNMSISSFSRFIRKHTSKSFVRFLTDIRLGIAARFLLETDDNIADISFKCGFTNLSNFNRSFKQAKGMTPTLFRKNYKEHKI
ncbi:MAG: AraC family transcriptional regulator [Mediterranea sp.]|jgi:AraC-like DNA-binding protein|nr:AraC family transcriptional regulator [Mediterranea sp.]